MCAPGPELGVTLHPGEATGRVLVLDAPLSLWGGTDERGVVRDRHHPQCGECLARRVVVLPAGRGSSSSASVLAEQVRAGHAPAALVLGEVDPILVLGALVAGELYGRLVPVVALDDAARARLRTGATARVSAPSSGPAEVRIDAGR